MGVGITVSLIMNGVVGDHPLGHELFNTVFADKGIILISGKLPRQRHNDTPRQLRIPLLFGGFNCIPERLPVRIFPWRIGRQQDALRHNFFLLVAKILRPLVVLAEQLFSGHVGSTSHGGLPLTALADGHIKVRTRHCRHPTFLG